jgi:ribose transport system permease protein
MSLLVQKRLRLPVHWRFNGALILLIVLYAAIVAVQPTFAAPPSIMVFLRRAAPLVVLACGQLPVLLTGGFDLSSGAVVTLTVLGGSMLTDGDPSRTAMAIPLLLLCGVGIGLANGLAVALLRVPSIIATLGSLLMVRGAALMWSGGAPSGYLPDNFRWLGRSMWRDVPLIHLLPAAVPATVIYAAMAALLTHRSILGRLWLAIGDNPRAAELAGVPVRLVRTSAFVVSGVSATLAGILLGGFAGVSNQVGDGLELQAIAACVLGGAELLGGGGTVVGAVSGALSLFALFTLLNLLGMPEPLRNAVQGVILIGAVALQVARRKTQ